MGDIVLTRISYCFDRSLGDVIEETNLREGDKGSIGDVGKSRNFYYYF